MRIVSIGDMKKEDVTGMATTVGSLCPTLAKSFSVTMAAEYLWTQVEPATAILCACIITYRPLFTNINIDLSNISGLFSKGSVESKGSRQGGWTDLENDSNQNYTWPVGKDSEGRDEVRLQDLNANATGDGLHIVNIDPLQSHNKPDTVVSKSVDVMEVRSNGNKPPYRSLPFEVTKDQTVIVNPFV